MGEIGECDVRDAHADALIREPAEIAEPVAQVDRSDAARSAPDDQVRVTIAVEVSGENLNGEVASGEDSDAGERRAAHPVQGDRVVE